MNNLNNNFLDDENAMEEIVEEIYEEEILEEEQAEVLTEAERRIEQANLYQALLKHDLFAPGSARPEIIDSVRREFKSFILSRLEVLLGIKPDTGKLLPAQEVTKNPFSEDEIKALRAIADRLTKKDQSQQPSQAPTPMINTVIAQPQVVQAPAVNAVNAQPQKVVKRVVKRVVASPNTSQQAQQPTKPQNKRKRTGNFSKATGQEYSQVVVEDNLNLRPKPMPSQQEIDMMNARQAQLNASGRSPVLGENVSGLGTKIAAVLLNNKGS
jgi:hypothetical protein